MAKRVVVIGGGVVGLCCAYFLEREGHHVTVLDRGHPDSERCSSGNSGLVVPSHFVPLAAPGMVGYGLKQMLNPKSPFRIKPTGTRDLVPWLFRFWRSANARHVERAGPVLRDLNLLSRRLYVGFAEDAEFGFEQRGLLMICREPATFHHELEVAQSARQLGLQTEALTPDDLERLEPGAPYTAAGAVYFPQDCSLDPHAFTEVLRERLRDLRHGVEVHRLLVDANAIEAVETDQGAIEGEAFVLAGGVWSAILVKQLGLNLPLQPGKGYSMTLEAPRHRLTLPSILVEGRVAITPLGDRLRVGGTMELGAAGDEVDHRRVQGIVETFCRYLPSFREVDFEGVPVWKGHRPCSPDGVPYIGPFARFPNLFAATGHAMMGLSLGPATGYLIAQHVAGTTPEIASPLLSPDRF